MNVRINVSNIKLETDRLIIRAFLENDLNDLYEYAKVEGVGQMAGWPHHQSIEASKIILKRFIEKTNTFALYHKETKKVIGSLGLEKYNEKYYKEYDNQKGLELGYVLSKAYWGKGLMPEAVRRVIKYLFEEQSLDFITCSHFIHNSQSRRVIEKSGFRFVCEGVFDGELGKFETRNYIIRKEEYQDGKI
ncbi:MAG: GNAT family N-acetyltransferase [Roseburia sp.]|nr:GNAT family N-acetyltransferase [Anaeroplasma bactoclasticum]MCM1196969.1 GNAT family N-acetyltransferase [Roseburia sp.]MCM1557649.1 GNAT family N-acetyltransferase [Anaeroplasma bactoclasticum]